MELIDTSDHGRNDAQHHRDGPSILKNVHTKAPDASHAVGQVQIRHFLEFLFVAGGHDSIGNELHSLMRHARELSEGMKRPVDSHVREVAGLQVQIGSIGLTGLSQQFINVHTMTLQAAARLLKAYWAHVPSLQRNYRRVAQNVEGHSVQDSPLEIRSALIQIISDLAQG